jgi:tetratricopeptide (TPR) repeat protein
MANKKPKAGTFEIQKKKEVNSLWQGKKLYAIIIFSFSALLYFNSVFNDYNMDDELVTQNHRLTSKGISAIPEIFTSPYYEDKAGYKYEYRPIVLVSFAIEHSLFGEYSWISHLINVLLYALLCLLLFKVLGRLLLQYSIIFPFLITLLFAAYPLHTEVVASIKNRDEILALIFGLLSLYFSWLFAVKKGTAYLPVACLFFLLGILSKTTTITFALLIPVTLVLLSEVSFSYLMLTTITLAIPAVFFARLYSAPQQIGLFVLLLAASVALYCLKYYKDVLVGIKKFTSKNFYWMEVKEETVLQMEHSLDFSFLKNRLVLLSFTVLVLLSIIISAAGVSYDLYWMAGLPLLVLAVLFILVREELKLLLIAPITFAAVLSIIKIHSGASGVESALILFLGGIILYRNKTFKTVGLVCYLLYAVAVAIMVHSFYSFIGVLFILMLFKRTYKLSYFAVAVVAAFSVKVLLALSKGNESFDISLLSMPGIIAGVILVWRKKANWLLTLSVLLIPVLVGYYVTTSSNNHIDVFNVVENSYMQAKSIRATDLTPVQTVRPFNFIEIPISPTDPLTIKLGTAMLVLGKYLKLLLLPYPMSFYYGYSYISPVAVTEVVPMLSVVVYVSLLLAAIFFFKKSPLLSFSILFYLISISVFSNLALQVPGMMGDRFLFIPSLGFCFFLVFILSKISKQHFDKTIDFKAIAQPMKISFLVILVLYSLLTFSRNADWKNRVTLFRHDIKTVENSAQAQNLLGLHLLLTSAQEADALKRKELQEESLVHFKRAVAIYPKFLNATFDRARLLEQMGRYDEALVAYQEATKIDTNFTTPYFAMGIIYQNSGKEKEAAECYEKYLPAHLHQMEVYANLSYSYFKQQMYDKSIATNQRALAVNVGAFDPTINIAKTYKQIGVKDSALYYFERAQLIRPDASIAAVIADLKNKK